MYLKGALKSGIKKIFPLLCIALRSKLLIYLFFFFVLSLWDLSFLTKDGTWALNIEIAES